jgi:hypothetical protein
MVGFAPPARKTFFKKSPVHFPSFSKELLAVVFSADFCHLTLM